ncbi:MAG: hypothetical protein HY014_18710 [Acidobacteria bacterium]|nr:hypothetical protein [Acidobacteriota bacterium]MBI3490169.1 hypothetical protein [Acidobacteriota bacterium]
MMASPESLTKVDGIGVQTARQIHWTVPEC